jgi:putative membrane protein
MARYESPLSYLIKGAIAGAAGTAAMSALMQRAPELMERAGITPASPPPPEKPEEESEPTAELAERVASGVLQEPIDDETKATAGQAIHWAYGAAWGAYYAVIQGTFNFPRLLHGTLFGALVAGVASTLVPRMGLVPRPQDQPMQLNAMNVGTHLVYGWVTAIVFGILTFFRR